jgi:membrane-associated HD superfamily phosphohydrolase
MKLPPVKKLLYKLLTNPRIQAIFLMLCAALALSALIFPLATRPPIFELKVGDVSPEDIQAPRSLEYESLVLTEKMRSEAEKSILPIYLPADPAIARRNIEHMRVTLAYINSVRMDAYASTEQKSKDLSAAQYIKISPSLSEQLLTLDEARWETVQKESLNVLEQIMRTTIREDRIDEVKRTIPTLISFSLTEDLASLVNEITTAFITPNSLYSPEQTEQARLAARQAITPIINRYIAGETIVRRGQVINETAWEALQQFGIIQHQDRLREIIAAIALTVTITSFTGLYFTRRKTPILATDIGPRP